MSRSRAVLSVDPLDAMLGESGARSRHPGPAVVASSRRKVRATFHLPRSLVDEARNATVALSGPPIRLTLARLVEEALRREIQRLCDTHNAGSPFPPREAELTGGRPIRS